MDKKLKKTFIWVTVILMVFILVSQYKLSFDVNKEPPSEKWGKGKKITNAEVKSPPRFYKNSEGYLILLNNSNKLTFLQIDNLGNLINSKEISIDGSMINNLSFIKKQQGYFISWDCIKLNENAENYVEVDNRLNKINEGKINGVNESFQVNEKILLRAYDKKIEIVDFIKDTNKFIEVNGANLLRAVEVAKDKYMLMFITKDGYIKSCYYKNGEISDLRNLCALNLPLGQGILNTALGFDHKYAYLIMFKKTKKGFSTERYSFELSNLEKKSMNIVNLQGIDEVKDIQFISTENGKAKFLGQVSRYFGIKKQYEDLVEFYLKDNEISVGNFVSKSAKISSNAAINEDTAIYCDYVPESESYDVYFTSTKEDFKKENNNAKKEEKIISAQDTAQGFMYALIYVIILGLKWILPAVMVMSIISFLEYRLQEKSKKILFVTVSIMTFLIKCEAIYITNYKNFKFYLPKQLSSVLLGFFICFIISLIFYVFGYLNYKDDLDAMPIAKFMPYLILDSVFTLMVFAPYML
ncbi:ABC transporter permease [Clostridium sp. KNHs214]|uniref:ABC transporter permease n=1 Tax=Clostridium sp. KNHs214 TaxID=1540257 RepID=UPI0005513635|nr:ABC transporter permease [Clostridium sp. KNHs214]